MIEEKVTALWPLSKTYEYAAELGLSIRLYHHHLWQDFLQKRNVDDDILGQIGGYIFLEYLEKTLPRQELITLLSAILANSAPRLKIELDASFEWLDRYFGEQKAEHTTEELDGEKVYLVKPTICQDYNNSGYLDAWTEKALEGSDITEINSRPATDEQLSLAHDATYLKGVWQASKQTEKLAPKLTPETPILANSEEVCKAASGALIAATRLALEEKKTPVLAWVHPGSHHAERKRGGGTCIINNLAVAAYFALTQKKKRIAIIDIDAHHGNGSEDIFKEDNRVFTLSLHQKAPFFPGTGSRKEKGVGRGENTNLNIPLQKNDDYLKAFKEGMQAIKKFNPELCLVEFSTDAHYLDPVSDLVLKDKDYYQIITEIENVGVPVVYELGASLSHPAWIGGIRALIKAANKKEFTERNDSQISPEAIENPFEEEIKEEALSPQAIENPFN